jgi:hypothetical protein
MNPDEEIAKDLLRSAIRPVPDLQLQGDLWPQMLKRIQASEARWSFWDWAALAAVVAGLAASPPAWSLILYAL